MVQKRNLTKDKIIAAALEFANDIGVRELTFPRLAEKLGIKYPSLYNHYPNLEELRTDMAAWLFRLLNEEVGRSLIGKSRGAAVSIYATAYRNLAMKYRGSYELLTSIPKQGNKSLYEESSKHAAILMQILESFELDRAALIHKSRFLRSAIHGFISLNILGFLQTEIAVSTEESFLNMISDIIALCEQK
ncbi:transcriptional regulator, TetR family [Paenibacillus sp. yr247]|uniref:TetR/AcrR family transcriptional regulator n=1 Tax=Paenibacillus sp. yr247 TaxID=1761880 RepID=UPI0008901888|nr:TetR-like C-terminal domain-containing protein [Paenibacillus sp. yr247]SDO25222.1 transcriptional regulator, TetR family [Paenibacillus sp. yr247]